MSSSTTPAALPIVTRTPQEVVRLWVQALRSGEYQQGKRALRSGDSFCCLGVLCDLAAKDGGEQWQTSGGGFWTLRNGNSMPSSKFEEFLRPILKRIAPGRVFNFDWLAEANDAGNSFKAIANAIERNYDCGDSEYE